MPPTVETPVKCGAPTKRSGFKKTCRRKVASQECKCHSHRKPTSLAFV